MSSSTMTSSATSKSRRELFEEQLQDLQRDISSLSSKLAVPNLVTSARLNSSGSHGSFLDSSLHSITHDVTKGSNLVSDLGPLPSVGNNISEVELRSQLETTKEELRKALRDKEDALCRVEQLKKEVEELHKNSFEIARLKVVIDTLKQDNDALKLSLESSERLRVQQKDLIAMLHKSHALMGEASVVSFNSISSISHRGDADSLQPLPPTGNNSVAENRDWLLTSPQVTQATPPSHTGPTTRSSGAKSSRRTSSAPSPATSSSHRPVAGTPSSSAKKPHSSVSSASKPKHGSSSAAKGKSKPLSSHETTLATAAHQTFSEIMAPNPSLVSPNAFPGYPPDWSNRPSYAALQGAGAFSGMFPPPYSPHAPLGATAATLALYPESAGQSSSGFWAGHMTPSTTHMASLSEGVGRPPLYPHSRVYSQSPAPSSAASNPPIVPSSVPISLPSSTSHSHAPPVTPAKGKTAAGPSGSKVTAKKKSTKKTATSSKEPKRSNSAPSSARVLVRPVASPPSTFSRASRQFGR